MPARNSTAPETGTIPNVARPSVIRPVFVGASVTEVKKPFVVARHQHWNYEIIFVEKGLYRCRHNETDFTLGRNGLLIVKPGDWHSDIFDGRYLRYLGFEFSLHVVPGIPLSIFRENTPVERQHFTIQRADFMPIFSKIVRELRTGDFVSAHIQDALVLEFFYRMVRMIPRAILSDFYVATSREASFSANLFSVINERLTRKLSVAELAAALGISASSLAHKCRAILHCSPARLLRRVRMDRAMQMLKSTDMLIKEVSAYLGFDDPFNFSRAFKKEFGKAPLVVKDNPPSSI